MSLPESGAKPASAAYRIDGQLVPSQAFYEAACDPRRSIVVEACAGAGKTWMLVSRILRALLDGAQPQQILALTFTRKAAGEMRARLDDWLREMSAPLPLGEADSARLTAELQVRGLNAAEAHGLAPALAGLHAQLLAGGRSVAVRSFHAWFAQLVAAAPLDTLRAIGLPAQPALIEKTDDLQDELFARFHAVVQADAGLRQAYAQLIRVHRLNRVTSWLATAWDRRVEVERADAAGCLASSVPSAAEQFPALAGLPSAQALLFAHPLHGELVSLASALGRQSGVKAQAAADGLRAALDLHEPTAAYDAACKALLTDKGSTRKLGEVPGLEAAGEALREIERMVDQQQAHEDHARMVALTRVLLREYAQMKHERGLADMGDLESAALALLADPVLAGWLQARLDTRLRHLLIDEFQDTSPLQWHALVGWLSSFAGAGGGASGQEPLSLFIVGDPKQSIYRFRRAEPRIFEAAKDFVVQGLGGSVLACDHTRRCAPAIVAALNAVFEPAAASGEWPGFRAHSTAAAQGEGGLYRLPEVLRPPREARAGAVEPVWRDTLTQPRHEPDEQRRAQEARHVARAIAELLAKGQQPADIMVLARKRVALRAVSEALSALQVPHVMPEPMKLGEEAEARDLLAVLDVLCSTGHDLSLAQALKSPLFGASDDELLQLSRAARASGSTWWGALLEATVPWSPALERARGLLRRWSEVMAWLPPHDLLDRILHEGELVVRLTATVPAARRERALQVVDGLMAAALELDGGRYATPYGFVRALRSRSVETQAVPAADAVSLLTVHGAKGLEAAVVFVVDSDPNRGPGDAGTLLVDWPVELDAPRRVAFVAVDSRPPPSLQDLQAGEVDARAREELNGLYVAMTRAAERLVISRTEPHQRPSGGGASWWQRIEARALPWEPLAAEPLHGAAADVATCVDLPELRVRPRRMASAEVPPVDAERAARGTAVHRVLEWMSAPGADRSDAARALAAVAAAAMAGLPRAAAADIEHAAAAVLERDDCRRFFDPAVFAWAGNEVPVLVDGEPGRIDRLVAFDEPAGRTWWVLDYKLHAAPEQVAPYRAQVAGYVRALQALQPGDRVCGALVAADGRLVTLDG